jgi:hypothetical protein
LLKKEQQQQFAGLQGFVDTEDSSHLCSQQSRPGCVLQDVTCLKQGNAREPLDELMHRSVFFEVREERGDRDPCASDNPCTTYAIRVALDIGAGRPVTLD